MGTTISCPVCQTGGRITTLEKRGHYLACGLCGRIYTKDGLRETEKSQAREWNFRIGQIRSAACAHQLRPCV